MRDTIDVTTDVTTAEDDPPISGPARAPLSPALAQKLADQWEAVQPSALGFALRLTKKAPDPRNEAEELVDEAFMSLLEGRRRWNPETDLTKRICGIIGSNWTQRVIELDRQAQLDPDDTGGPPASAPDPERLLSLKREHEERVALLDELALEYPEGSLERDVIRLTRQDIIDPAEQAEELGLGDVNKIYNARRNLGNAMERLERARRKKAQRGGP